MVTKKKLYQWDCSEVPKRDVSPEHLARIRSLVVYWDTLETGAPRICLAAGTELEDKSSEIINADFLGDIEYFLAAIPPQNKGYKFTNPYFNNPALTEKLYAIPDKEVRTLLSTEKTITYKPTPDEISLWKMANFRGAGIDPKRPFEGFEDLPDVKHLSLKTFSRLLLLMQAILSKGTLLSAKKSANVLLSEDQWESRIYGNSKGYLESVCDSFVEAAPIPRVYTYYGESELIEAPLIKSIDYFPKNFWYRLFFIRYLSLHEKNSRANDQIALLKKDIIDSNALETLSESYGTLRELIEWEAELANGTLSKISLTAIRRILKRLSDKALSERSHLMDPHAFDAWYGLDFNDEHLFHYLRSILYQNPIKSAVPGRWIPKD